MSRKCRSGGETLVVDEHTCDLLSVLQQIKLVAMTGRVTSKPRKRVRPRLGHARYNSSCVYCVNCGEPAGSYCECGSTLRIASSTWHIVRTTVELQRVRRRYPRPNARMLRSMLPEFFTGGVVVDIGIDVPNTAVVAALRAAGYIHRKRKGTPRQRARKKRRLQRRIRYFQSGAGIAQSVEILLEKNASRREEHSYSFTE